MIEKKIDLIMEDILSEVTEGKRIHIKKIGKY